MQIEKIIFRYFKHNLFLKNGAYLIDPLQPCVAYLCSLEAENLKVFWYFQEV